MTKDQLLPKLSGQKLMVVSTCSQDEKPEAALVGFAETENFELIFATNSLSRKYWNLQRNPQVAIVIGFGEDRTSIQYEGRAEEIPGNILGKYLEIYHAKSPSAHKYQALENQAYFKVTPRWIRYVQLKDGKEVGTEFTF